MAVNVVRYVPHQPPVLKVEAFCHCAPADSIAAQDTGQGLIEVMQKKRSTGDVLAVILTPEDAVTFSAALIELASQQMKKGE